MNTDMLLLAQSISRMDIDILEKIRVIEMKRKKGRQHLKRLKDGHDEVVYQHEYNDLIINLIHFKHYVYFMEQLFLEWHNDEIITHTLSEQMYLYAAAYTKELHDEFNKELYDITLYDLLYFKANGDESKIEKLHNIYLDLVGKELLEAKQIKSLRRG